MVDISPEYDAEILHDIVYFPFRNNEMLNSLSVKIANVKPDESVLDPTFGLGIIEYKLLKNNNDQEIYGQEPNITYYNATLAQLYFNHSDNVHIHNSDALREPLYLMSDNNPKFDVVINQHPVSCKLGPSEEIEDIGDRFKFGELSKYQPSIAYMATALSGLKDTGRAILGTPNSDLFQNNRNSLLIRKNLLTNDYVEAVISLPIENKTNFSNILVINLNKKRLKNKVRMINASNLDVKCKDGITYLSKKNEDRIVDTFNRENEFMGFVKNVPVKDILKNDSSLIVKNYINSSTYEIVKGTYVDVDTDSFSSTNTRDLKDIAELYRGYNLISKMEKESSEHKFLKISNIEDDTLVMDDLTHGAVNKNVDLERYRIKKGDIILSVRGFTNKMAYVDKDYPDLYLTQNLVGIRTTSEDIMSEWLYEFFQSPLGMAELEAIRIGTVVSQLPTKYLKKIQIPILDMDKQRSAVAEYDEKKATINDIINQLNDDIDDAKLKLYENMGIDKYFKVKGTGTKSRLKMG